MVRSHRVEVVAVDVGVDVAVVVPSSSPTSSALTTTATADNQATIKITLLATNHLLCIPVTVPLLLFIVCLVFFSERRKQYMCRHKLQFEWPGCARKDCEKGWTLVWQPFVSIYFILKEGKEGKKKREETTHRGRGGKCKSRLR